MNGKSGPANGRTAKVLRGYALRFTGDRCRLVHQVRRSQIDFLKHRLRRFLYGRSTRHNRSAMLYSHLFMLLAGVITLIIASMLLAYLTMRFPLRRSSNLTTDAEATILNIQYTRRLIGSLPIMKVMVQVKPQSARSFVAELRHRAHMDQITALRQGATVRVRYRPDNRKRIRLISDPSLTKYR